MPTANSYAGGQPMIYQANQAPGYSGEQALVLPNEIVHTYTEEHISDANYSTPNLAMIFTPIEIAGLNVQIVLSNQAAILGS